ncbi:MAG: endonuclease/exonuclease/phosphatase family protein [Planctomycetota bacterium]
MAHRSIQALFSPLNLRGLVLAWFAWIGVGVSGAYGDQLPVVLDGETDEWSAVTATTDAAGDGASIDLLAMRLADDDLFLFIRFDVAAELLLNDGHDLTLWIDTDNNASTGTFVAGIGADLEWRFGDRQGDVTIGGSTDPVYHNDIGLRGAPAVTATSFEVAIARSSVLAMGSTVRVVLRDEAALGDRIPLAPGGVSYTFDVDPIAPDSELPTTRELPTDLRFVSFNVKSDAPWEGAGNRIGRQIAAIAADVYCFQEIYDHSASEVESYVAGWIDPPPGSSWHSASQNDCKIISRFPITQAWALSGNLAALLDTTAEWGFPTLVVNAHLPCCGNNSGRQDEVDEILAFVRDQRSFGVLASNPGTALVFTGDLNLVGDAQQLTSLLDGDVIDEATWGSDAVLDADGSEMTDTVPRQVARRMAYTWRNDSSSFWPGRLDFFIFSDSIIAEGRSFVLYTPELSSATLATLGLQSNDSSGSDHFPLVVDLRPAGPPGSTDFRRGDCNQAGGVSLPDAVNVLAYAFSQVATDCPDACDFDDDGSVNVGDAVGLLSYLFGGASGPAAPDGCGSDTTPSGLDPCTSYTGCP